MAPQNRAGDDISIRRRRLAYRAAHRGTRELDLLLGPYTAARAGIMDAAELDALERLLDEADTTLQTWFLGQEEPPAHQQPLIHTILAFRQTST
jgi:antitoxin CptB